MRGITRDLTFALRTLLKNPGFAAIAILTLALGIGANTAIFSVVDSVLLRGLPYADADRLVLLGTSRDPNALETASSWPDYVSWRDDNKTFEHMASFREEPVTWAGDERAERLDGMAVSANLFKMLGVEPTMGRGFAPGEDTAGKNHVAILSHLAWSKRFHADPAIVGRSVSIDGEPVTIVGVLPATFHFVGQPNETEIWLPVPRSAEAEMKDNRGAHYFGVLGKLEPGVTLVQARADLDAINKRLADAFPASNANRHTIITAVHEALVHELRPSLFVLLVAVAFVLLIACANVANLLLARASARQRELAIRVALGASRGRLVRQMLTESVLMSVFGGAVGLVLALWGLDALRAVVPADLARLHPIKLDARVLAFTFGVAVLTGLVFGLIPALQSSGPNPNDALKQSGTRTTAHGARQRARNALVAAEIALAMLLLVGSGLMIRSFQRLTGVDPGFKSDGLLTATVTLPDTRYHGDDKAVAFYHELLPKLQALPGTQGAALAFPMPFSNANIGLRFTIDGRPPPPPGQDLVTNFRTVSPGYFDVMQIRVLKGRAFTTGDDTAAGEPVTVVTEAFVRKYFPDEDPIGKRVNISFGKDSPSRRIIGVVGDVHYGQLEKTPDPGVYCPFSQAPLNFMFLVIRGGGTGMGNSMRDVVASIDHDLPIADIQPMNDMIGATLSARRVGVVLLGIFGAAALLLALVGVYGVMSYLVTQKTQEIGIRVALGARPGEVVRMVLGHGLALAGIGVAVGVAAALALTRFLASQLYGVNAADPLTYGAIAALLLGVAALACWIPARRASRVDPMVALRSE